MLTSANAVYIEGLDFYKIVEQAQDSLEMLPLARAGF